MSAAPALLVANVGAEEHGELAAPARAQADRVAALWRRIFAPPAFAWLPGPGTAAAWLNTEAARQAARSEGLELFGAAPDVVRQVHDKAFAHAVAVQEGLLPAALRDAVTVLDPSELRSPETLAAALERMPAWARKSFTLKPRLGGSGRGRVAGADRRADTPAVRHALERLAGQGGALLEPWLRRREDLSAQLFLARDGSLTLLGTTRQVLTPAGLYRGQRGLVDYRGRVVSGSEDDEALRTAAAATAAAAHREGFWGPCGVDAFRFETPDGGTALRAPVELNARFTVGTVVVGLLRRHLAEVASRLGLAPGERRAFSFLLDTEAPEPMPPDALFLPLGDTQARRGPGLLIARDEAVLDDVLARADELREGIVAQADAEPEGALPGRS